MVDWSGTISATDTTIWESIRIHEWILFETGTNDFRQLTDSNGFSLRFCTQHGGSREFDTRG